MGAPGIIAPLESLTVPTMAPEVPWAYKPWAETTRPKDRKSANAGTLMRPPFQHGHQPCRNIHSVRFFEASDWLVFTTDIKSCQCLSPARTLSFGGICWFARAGASEYPAGIETRKKARL